LGQNPKEALQVAPEGKISTLLPVFSWKAWFEWAPRYLEDRLSELADYRKINGHCNVPSYKENAKLANCQTKGPLQVAPEGKRSQMTSPVFRH
jgi:hypothetical protein